MKKSISLRAIILAGTLLLQLNTVCCQSRGAAGDADPSFHAGLGADARVNAVTVQPGDVDLSFDGSGVNGTVSALAGQPDGKVIIGGDFTTVKGLTRIGIARLNADGSGDATFNAGTSVDRKVSAIALQPDGKVIVTRSVPGISDPSPALNYPPVRLHSDGTIDNTFIPQTESYQYGSGYTCVVLQPDGKVLLGGYFTEYYVDGEGFIYYYQRSLLIRLNANGTADPSFAFASGDFDSWIAALTLQLDGKVLIGGNFFTANGTSRNGIARLNSDGSLDASFNPGTGVGGSPHWVKSVAMQLDGKVLLGGWFSSINGTMRNGIARLNADGSLDGSFNPGTGTDGNVASIALQPDGKVVLGGDFTTVNGTTRNRIARIHSNASLDTSFNPGTGVEGSVRSIALESDGDVLIGGNFLTVNGVLRSYVARLHGGSGSPPNQPPVVGVSSPADGATYAGPATIVINVDAEDADGTVVQLDVYAGDTLLASDSFPSLAVTWENVAPGTYSLTAIATDNLGATTRSLPVHISVTAPSAPIAPSGLAATAVSRKQINLTWTDNASNEDGCKIERSTNGKPFKQIAIVGPNVTIFSNTGLIRGNKYTYRVRAYNPAGNSSYSNTATAKTTRRLAWPVRF